MGKTSVIPLAKGLIGSKAKTINGQMEVTYHNYKTVEITIWRRMYTGQPDVKFKIADTDLPDIIEILIRAQRKIENHWLSKIAKQTYPHQK
ncbi:MAG: hypothetical protein QXZ47_04920 [Candidatus Bathyarchaeia archaeon]